MSKTGSVSSSHISLHETSPPTPQLKSLISDELQQILSCSVQLADDTSNNYSSLHIHPLHIALALLYEGLTYRTSPWLHEPTKTWHVYPWERSLFWLVIGKAARNTLPISLDEHICHVTHPDRDTFIVQNSVGQAIWNKVEGLSDHDLQATGDQDDDPTYQSSRWNDSTRGLLSRAKEICHDKADEFIAPHHVLLALLKDALVREILESQDLDPNILEDQIKGLRQRNITRSESLPRFSLLNQFATDLTEEIYDKIKRNELIDPVIGRNYEVRHIIEILSRCSKNNAVLLGDPGVGKTAIAEGLAYRIVKQEVPESVVARVFNLDLGALLASTACKSAYERIVELILQEIAEHEERGIRVILFVDELSQITIGGWRDDGTGLDAATLMKPFLSKGKLRCVGCSTFEDYRDSVEKDAALSRQFSAVFVCESTVPETVAILRGMKKGLEQHHNVVILDDSIMAAASIAAQYFTHKRLPDAAIDLVDEACAALKTAGNEQREKRMQLQRRQVLLEMDIASLEREYDEDSAVELTQALAQLSQVQQQLQQISISGERSASINSKLEELNVQIKQKERDMLQYGKAGQRAERLKCVQELWKLKDARAEEMSALERLQSKQLDNVDESQRQTNDHASNSEEAKIVTKRDIVQAASWYRPVHCSTWKNAKQDALAKFLETLPKMVIGQEEAVDAVSSAIRCMMSGLTDPTRPVASFIFGGPAGSGKTFLAKELAKALLGSTSKLVSINAGDYNAPHTLTRLIGTPVCTGFDHGGQLTECVRRKPFSVILIREIENACPEFRLYIQRILDEGSTKDGAGKAVDFRNCIVIITTGIGQINSKATFDEDEERKHYLNEINEWFSVEFLARIDELVVFRRITVDIIGHIIAARLEEISKQLTRLKLHLTVDDEVQWYLEDQAWPADSGARHLEKVIRDEIIHPLAIRLLDDRDIENWRVRLSIEEYDDGITIELLEPLPPVDLQSSGGSSDTETTTAPSPSASVNSLLESYEPRQPCDSVTTGSLEPDQSVVPTESFIGSTFRPPIPQFRPQRLF